MKRAVLCSNLFALFSFRVNCMLENVLAIILQFRVFRNVTITLAHETF